LELSTRLTAILRSVVEAFLADEAPVSSGVIAEICGLGLSPATIRGEFRTLTSLGYLRQGHTSGGRIPTEKAYRTYLLLFGAQSSLSTSELNAELRMRIAKLDALIADLGVILDSVRANPAFALLAGDAPDDVTAARRIIKRLEGGNDPKLLPGRTLDS
jgi:heat-inducible transcriptional repressor